MAKTEKGHGNGVIEAGKKIFIVFSSFPIEQKLVWVDTGLYRPQD